MRFKKVKKKSGKCNLETVGDFGRRKGNRKRDCNQGNSCGIGDVESHSVEKRTQVEGGV